MLGESCGVAIVILNWRQPDLSIAAIASCEADANEMGDVKVVCVDNDSRDGSADTIEAAIHERGWSSWARVVRSPRNGGFSWGNNVGVKAVDAYSYLFLNSDAQLTPGCLAALRAGLDRDEHVGLVGPRIEHPDGTPQASCFRERTPFTEFLRAANTGVLDRFFAGHRVSRGILTEPTDGEWISFACVLVRRSVFDAIGPMDDGYFLYFEDIDFGRAARDAGFRIRHLPDAVALHDEGGSTGVGETRAARKRLPSFFYEARTRYFAKWHGGKLGVIRANLAWILGRMIVKPREWLGRPTISHPHEGRDNWTRWRNPFDPPTWPRDD